MNLSDKFSDTLILAPKTPDTRNSGHEYYCNMYNHKYVNGVRGEHPLMLRGPFNASRNIICNDNLVKRYNADIWLLNKKTKNENFKANHNVIFRLSPGIRDYPGYRCILHRFSICPEFNSMEGPADGTI